MITINSRLPFNISSVITTSLEWRQDAACKDVDPSEFFPEQNTPTNVIKICEKCPVKQECLDFAIRNKEIYGIWGGMGYRTRLKYIRQQKLIQGKV